MSRLGVNFTALMRDASGLEVPGSLRQGHNVMTEAGRDHLARLILWSAFGTPDVAITGLRARWIGVGDGTQPEAKEVVRLASPVLCSTGQYLKPLDATLTVFPTITSVTVKVIFAPTEISIVGPALVSEAGLYFDAMVSGATSLNSSVGDNVPAFYKTFEPMVKLNTFSMEILWELKF